MVRPVLWRMAVWGAFLLLGLTAVGITGLPAGGPGGVFATATRIAREGVPTIGGDTALIGPLDGMARGLAYYRGDYWHAAPPGAALLAAPAAWFGVPLADTSSDPGATVLVVGLTGVFLLLAVAAALAWAGERMDILPRVALLAAVLGVGTLLWPVGTLTNTTALVAIVGVLVAITLADGADAPRRTRLDTTRAVGNDGTAARHPALRDDLRARTARARAARRHRMGRAQLVEAGVLPCGGCRSTPHRVRRVNDGLVR